MGNGFVEQAFLEEIQGCTLFFGALFDRGLQEGFRFRVFPDEQLDEVDIINLEQDEPDESVACNPNSDSEDAAQARIPRLPPVLSCGASRR